MILLIKALVWTVVSFLIIALALFLPAGTVLWPAGWVFLILLLGFTLVNIGLLFTSKCFHIELAESPFRTLPLT